MLVQISSGGQRAVSRAMLEEVKEREHQAEAQVSARQAALEKAGLDKDIQRLSAELTQLQGKTSGLRQVSCSPISHLCCQSCHSLTEGVME